MKTYKLLLLPAIFILSFASCAVASPDTSVTTATDTLVTEQIQAETTPMLEVPRSYCDDLWRSTAVKGSPWMYPVEDRKEIVGEEFEITYAFLTEDHRYSEENYDFEFTVSDPTVAEVLVYGYDNKVLYDGWPSAVRLKGLKPGMIWVEMKMIHKETGGVYCTYVGVEIVLKH